MKTRLIILSIITCAHVGLVSGLVYFDADVVIEDDIEKIDISYGYDGGFIGMHFMFQLRVQFQESWPGYNEVTKFGPAGFSTLRLIQVVDLFSFPG